VVGGLFNILSSPILDSLTAYHLGLANFLIYSIGYPHSAIVTILLLWLPYGCTYVRTCAVLEIVSE
jgi:hypothetical protein